jgi:type IV pilus assembly protein PilB
MQQKRRRLGDMLVGAGVISQDQLNLALQEQKKSSFRLGDQLAEMGLLSEQQLIEILEFQLGIPHVNLYKFKIEQSLLNIISEDLSRRYQVLPLKKNGNKLTIAMSDPLDYYAIDDLRLSTGFIIEPAIAKKEELKLAINRYYGMQKSIDQMMKDLPDERVEDNTDLSAQQIDDSPAAKMVNQLITQAAQQGASDIHIDPLEEETKIRLRVDGVLRTERILPKHMHAILSSRIKIMAKLDIAEKRAPQDGRFQMEVEFRKIDLRISILPTIFGEKIVMRLLDLNNVFLGVEKLGFSIENQHAFEKIIQSAYGLVLVTGPTGSGKTTTLYSALNKLNTDEVNVITVEDPVEYQIKGVNQVQVNSNVGMTFAIGLRSILRQDPNVIMVGEIRDTETAEIALRAAMTGHLVLSTLHTNDAISSITRLIDMGIEPFLVASSLAGIMAQRLVRKVCPSCAETYKLTDDELELFISRGLSAAGVKKGQGCSHCHSTGYKGRIAIHEVIHIDDFLRSLITQKQSDAAYRQLLQRKEFVNMFEDGLIKVASGITTLDEIFRVSIENE